MCVVCMLCVLCVCVFQVCVGVIFSCLHFLLGCVGCSWQRIGKDSTVFICYTVLGLSTLILSQYVKSLYVITNILIKQAKDFFFFQ